MRRTLLAPLQSVSIFPPIGNRIELVDKYRKTIPEPLPFTVEPTLKAVSYADYKALFMTGLAALGLTLVAFASEVATYKFKMALDKLG